MKKNSFILETIVFLSGAIVMILEIVGSRILAPYFGTSIFVWTSLIGVILGCLSMGYLLGGKLADHRPDYKTFAFLLLLAALFTAVAGVSESVLLTTVKNSIKEVRLRIIVGTFLLFGIPGVLLGTVSPFAVRLRLESLGTSGATVGRIYALSTIGSIVGTFSAGFFLIALIGSQKILFLLSLCLLLLSGLAYFVYSGNSRPRGAVALYSCAVIAILLAHHYLKPPFLFPLDFDTDYNRVWIFNSVDEASKRPVRNMTTDPRIVQSNMFLDKDDDLVYGYANFYRLAEHVVPRFKSTLMIGGAGYAYPKDYLRRFRKATIDVVEIDPGMTRLARKYFNLKDDPRLRIVHEDGRTFLDRTDETYDVILLDAIKSFYSVPYNLVTEEAIQSMYDRLEDNGALFVNMIGAFEGPNGRFFRAEYATCKAIFPQVHLFAADDNQNASVVQNIMLVCLKTARPVTMTSSDKEMAQYLGHLWQQPITMDMPILTDDFSPVDQYNLKML